MSKLDSNRDVRPLPDALECFAHRIFSCVIVQADVGVADAPFRDNCCRLDRQQTSAGKGKLPKMNKVPIRHATVDGRVGAHRSNGYTVLEFEVTDLEGCKKLGLGHEVTFGMG